MAKKIIVLLVFLFAMSQLGSAFANPDENLKKMMDAARKLEWLEIDGTYRENRAYLLVKQETALAPVGIIFGYGDNAAACEEIATALSNPVRVGTFKCSPIF